jgi:hypothetical protein
MGQTEKGADQQRAGQAPGHERTGESREQRVPGAKAPEQKESQGGEHKERTGESREQRAPGAKAPEQKAGQGGEHKERTGESREQHAPDARAPEQRERMGETREHRESGADRRDARSVQLTEERRTKIHDTIIRRSEGRVDNPTFQLSVGTRVPRTVHVYDVPDDVVTIVPEYRGYKYIIVRDELVILDPDTLEIVAVIPV